MMPAAGSSFKGKSDMAKYDKAMKLKGFIEKIRADYTKKLSSTDKRTKQVRLLCSRYMLSFLCVGVLASRRSGFCQKEIYVLHVESCSRVTDSASGRVSRFEGCRSRDTGSCPLQCVGSRNVYCCDSNPSIWHCFTLFFMRKPFRLISHRQRSPLKRLTLSTFNLYLPYATW